MRDQLQEVADATQSITHPIRAYLETATGATLLSIQFWQPIVADIDFIADHFTKWGAMLITAHGIYRICRFYWPKKPSA